MSSKVLWGSGGGADGSVGNGVSGNTVAQPGTVHGNDREAPKPADEGKVDLARRNPSFAPAIGAWIPAVPRQVSQMGRVSGIHSWPGEGTSAERRCTICRSAGNVYMKRCGSGGWRGGPESRRIGPERSRAPERDHQRGLRENGVEPGPRVRQHDEAGTCPDPAGQLRGGGRPRRQRPPRRRRPRVQSSARCWSCPFRLSKTSGCSSGGGADAAGVGRCVEERREERRCGSGGIHGGQGIALVGVRRNDGGTAGGRWRYDVHLVGRTGSGRHGDWPGWVARALFAGSQSERWWCSCRPWADASWLLPFACQPWLTC